MVRSDPLLALERAMADPKGFLTAHGKTVPQRRPRPGTGRVITADLVLLALGFDGPERDGGLMEQLGLRPDPRGNFARDTDFSAAPRGYSWPATRDAELH